MKILLLCVIFSILANTIYSEKEETEKSLQEEMDEIYNTCREQHNICPDEEKALEDCKIPESKDGKCFVGCCFQEMTLFHSTHLKYRCKPSSREGGCEGCEITNGKFNKTSCKDLATAMYEDDKDQLEKVMGVIDKCEEEVNGNDICENGPLLMSCIKNHGEGLFIPYPGMKFE